jgi:hypothetical protein
VGRGRHPHHTWWSSDVPQANTTASMGGSVAHGGRLWHSTPTGLALEGEGARVMPPCGAAQPAGIGHHARAPGPAARQGGAGRGIACPSPQPGCALGWGAPPGWRRAEFSNSGLADHHGQRPPRQPKPHLRDPLGSLRYHRRARLAPLDTRGQRSASAQSLSLQKCTCSCCRNVRVCGHDRGACGHLRGPVAQLHTRPRSPQGGAAPADAFPGRPGSCGVPSGPRQRRPEIAVRCRLSMPSAKAKRGSKPDRQPDAVTVEAAPAGGLQVQLASQVRAPPRWLPVHWVGLGRLAGRRSPPGGAPAALGAGARAWRAISSHGPRTTTTLAAAPLAADAGVCHPAGLPAAAGPALHAARQPRQGGAQAARGAGGARGGRDRARAGGRRPLRAAGAARLDRLLLRPGPGARHRDGRQAAAGVGGRPALQGLPEQVGGGGRHDAPAIFFAGAPPVCQPAPPAPNPGPRHPPTTTTPPAGRSPSRTFCALWTSSPRWQPCSCACPACR